MVQIVKEPISSKGPRLTTEISFTGRYMVLIPFGDKISISQKIKTTEEKVRLRQLMESIRPKNWHHHPHLGRRQKSGGAQPELKTLMQCWEETVAKRVRPPLQPSSLRKKAALCLCSVTSSTHRLRAGWVNDPEIYAQIRKYVSLIAPDRAEIVASMRSPEPFSTPSP